MASREKEHTIARRTASTSPEEATGRPREGGISSPTYLYSLIVPGHTVDFLLGLFAAGWTPEQILENYPTLTPEALRAVFAFAAEALQEESLYSVRLRTA
jgi:hypothetical protein